MVMSCIARIPRVRDVIREMIQVAAGVDGMSKNTVVATVTKTLSSFESEVRAWMFSRPFGRGQLSGSDFIYWF